jgi:hypothetical protein
LVFLGARTTTPPLGRFRRGFGQKPLFDTQNLGPIDTLRLSVLFFLKKEPKTVVPLRGRFDIQNLGLIDPLRLSVLFFLKKEPKTVVPLRGRMTPRTFCGAEQRFLLLFPEKEEHHSNSSFLCC